MAGECRQAGHGAHRITAPGGALHPVVEPDRRGANLPVVTRELLDLGGRDAAEPRHTLRVELAGTRGERIEAQRVALDVVAVEPAFAHQHMHHAECKGAVRARQQRDVLVALLSRQRTVRIDGDQLRAVALGFLRATPQVQVGRDGVGAPEDDQLRVLELLDVGAIARAERGRQAPPRPRWRRWCDRERSRRACERSGSPSLRPAPCPSFPRSCMARCAADRRPRSTSGAPQFLRAPCPTKCARTGPRPCDRRASADAAAGPGDRCARGIGSLSCTACPRSSDEKDRPQP